MASGRQWVARRWQAQTGLVHGVTRCPWVSQCSRGGGSVAAAVPPHALHADTGDVPGC